MGFRKVLVPLDGSQLAEVGLQYAQRVAEPPAEIHLISLVNDEHTEQQFVTIANSIEIAFAGTLAYPSAAAPTLEENIRLTKHYLEKVAERLSNRGYTIKVHALPGPVVDTIVDLAKDGFDAIIIATHGRTGLAKLMMGSIAEGVIRKSTVPVLLIPAHAAEL
jgi:nucleotide-binding universal stress UspA family protein